MIIPHLLIRLLLGIGLSGLVHLAGGVTENLSMLASARFFVDQCHGWGIFSGEYLCERTCNSPKDSTSGCVLDRTLKNSINSIYNFHCQCRTCPDHTAQSRPNRELSPLGELGAQVGTMLRQLKMNPLSVNCIESDLCKCPLNESNIGFLCSLVIPIPQHPYTYCTCCTIDQEYSH